MKAREYIIQRYAVGLWSQVSGRMPFVTIGPEFKRYLIPRSLETYGEHRFAPAFRSSLEEHFSGTVDWRPEVAELLLREGIVSALWSIDVATCAPADERWDRSILGVAAEIPGGNVGLWTMEFLSGISSPEHYQSMLATDGLTLAACPVP